MFEDFPYTNLHQLNLDWLVEVIEKLHDNMVISVNGQTGEVVLYKDATVQLPNVDNGAWTIIRNAHGVKRGIKFDSDGIAYIVSGNSLASVFTPENPPTSSQITYDQYVRLTTLTGEQLHNWNIFRTLNNQSTGIEFDDNGNAFIISGSDRFKIWTQKDYTDNNGMVTLPGVTNPEISAWSIGRSVNGVPCRIFIFDDGQVIVTADDDEYRLVNSEELEDLSGEVTDLKSAITNINYNNLRNSLKKTIGISNLYSVDLTNQLTTVTGGFYQEGNYITLESAKYYKLNCQYLDTIYLDRITPAWYDIYTVIDSDGNTIDFRYGDTSVSTARNKYYIDVSKANFVAFSCDSYNYSIKVMGIPQKVYSSPYTKNLNDRLTTYIGGKFYANGSLSNSASYRYTEYNVMGIDSVKISTYAEGWTDIYDLIDKDGSTVLSYELTQTKGYFTRIIDVSNACYIRLSTVNAKGGFTRVFGKRDYTDNVNAGKQIAVIGDSWVEYNETNTENFIDLSCRDLGIDWLNYGVGGTSYKATDADGTAYYQRAQTTDFNNCDLVLLFGSGNENTNIANGLLGTPTDTTSDTICGCVNLTIETILTRYPLTKVAIISPAPWQGFPNTTANNNFEKLSNALEAVAKRQGIPFLNLYTKSNMRPWIADFRTAYQPDGCHPNNAGHEFFYSTVRDFIKDII